MICAFSVSYVFVRTSIKDTHPAVLPVVAVAILSASCPPTKIIFYTLLAHLVGRLRLVQERDAQVVVRVSEGHKLVSLLCDSDPAASEVHRPVLHHLDRLRRTGAFRRRHHRVREA